MGPRIWERLADMIPVLRWIGRYEEARALGAMAHLMKARGFDTVEDWEKFVKHQTERSKPTPPPSGDAGKGGTK